MKNFFTFRQRPNESLTGKLARVSSDTLSQVSNKCRLTVGRLSTLLCLMLLTLGVNSAWGGTGIYLRGINNNWNAQTDLEFQETGTTNLYTITITLDNYYTFKVADSNWNDNCNYGASSGPVVGTALNLVSKGDNINADNLTGGTTYKFTLDLRYSTKTLLIEKSAKPVQLLYSTTASFTNPAVTLDMVYDETSETYHYDVTGLTNGTTYFFRYKIDGKEYSAGYNGSGEGGGYIVNVNGDKVAATQDLSSWGTKHSLYMHATSASTHTFYFDLNDNKKTWITAVTCTTPTISWNTTPQGGYVGESFTASVTTNYADGVTWTSSNTSVATVSGNGTQVTINFLKAGTTTIKAKVTGDGTTYCSTTATKEQSITVKSLGYAPTEVLSESNVMFYMESYADESKTEIYLCKDEKNQKEGVYLENVKGYINVAKTDLSSYYKISNNSGWGGKENNGIKSAQGGEYFKANDDVSTTPAKTAATTVSLSSGTLTIGTTTSSTTGVYNNLPLYIQYYIGTSFVGVTHDSKTATAASIPAKGLTSQASTLDVSGYADGTYTLKTVLTDGNIYYIADEDEFTIKTVYSGLSISDNGCSMTANSSLSATEVTQGQSVTINKGTPATGYEFDEITVSGGIIDGTTWTPSADNQSVTVKWKLKTHKFAWNFDGGQSSATAGTDYTAANNAMPYGTAITYPEASTMSRDGYNFTGWSEVISTMPDNDVTITAQWAKDETYTITIQNKWGDNIGDKGSMEVKKDVATDITASPLYPYAGFVFDKWETTEGVSVTGGETGAKVTASQAGTITAVYKTPTLSLGDPQTSYGYEDITFTPNVNSTFSGTAYVCYAVTAKPDGATVNFNTANVMSADKMGDYTIVATLHETSDCSSTEFARCTTTVTFTERYLLKETNDYTTFEYEKGATSASIDKTYGNSTMTQGGTYFYTYKDRKTNTEISPSKQFRYIIPGTFTFTLSGIGTDELDLTVAGPAAYVIQVNKDEHINTLVKPSSSTIFTEPNVSHDIEVSNIATGYHFVNWTGPSNVTFGNAESTSTTVSVSGPGSDLTVYIQANAAVNTWNVTAVANPTAGGIVTGSKEDVSQIDGCTVTATPNVGYYFNGWESTNGTFTDASALSTIFKPTAAAIATANFVKYQGITSLALDKTGKYNPADKVTVTPTLGTCPQTMKICYQLKQNDVEVEDITLTIDNDGKCSFTLPNDADADYTVICILHQGDDCTDATIISTEEITVPVQPEQKYTPTMFYNSEQGTATVEGEAGFLTTATITATPKTGYAFVNWTAEPSANVTFTSTTTTSTTINMTGAATITANFTPIYAYIEGRTKVKNEQGEETIINDVDNWNLKLKIIPMQFDATDKVYYLNTYCTTKELASYINTRPSFIRVGVAQGDGEVTCYSAANNSDYKFTSANKSHGVNTTNDASFYFRDVEDDDDNGFERRGPVMYKYNPTNNTFSYCAPKLTLSYNGDFATMAKLPIEFDKASTVINGLTAETVVLYYSTDDGASWTEWTDNITAQEGKYQLRAVASGNNEFGQPVTNVVSNIITVTVTTPVISAAITKINGAAGSVIRINDMLTITPTLQNVPDGAHYTICYHYSKLPAGSAIKTDVFTKGEGKNVTTYIDVEGDYTITVTLNDKACDQDGFINLATYDLNFHVKGDEITVYTKVEKSVNWEDHKIYYYKGTDVGTATWPGDEMTYIGKDSADYEWYQRIITNYKQYAGGWMVFNDGTGDNGLQQTVDVPMPEDDAFYFIKAAADGGKRTTETLAPVDVTPRVILLTDTTALYQYVTIDAEGKAVFFLGDDIKYEYSVKAPNGDAVELNSKNEFSPLVAGDYTLTVTATNRQDAGETITNTFTLRVAENPLTLAASPESGTIGSTVTLTLSSTQTLPSCDKTWTVIEPGSVDPITFKTTTGTTTSTQYTTQSSGTYTYQVILQDSEGKIIGKAQTTATVAAKDMYIKHPFKNTTSPADGDWKWVKMTYQETDGTYIYYSNGTDPSYYHSSKKEKANVSDESKVEGTKSEYTILNPDNVGDNTLAVFVYDLSANTVTVYKPATQFRVKSETENGTFYSNAVSTNDADLSFFATQDGKLSWQTRTTDNFSWTDMDITITNKVTKNAVYTAKVTISGDKPTNTLNSMTEYTGNFTVYTSLTTDAGDDAGSPTAADGLMTQFTKASSADYYNYYWVRYCKETKQAAATVGNDINHNLSVALPYYLLPADANVRYGYDNTTNLFQRTFLAGSNTSGFIQIYGENLYTDTKKATAINKDNRQDLSDGSDWIYTYSAAGDVTTEYSVTATLMTNYNSTQRWILAKSGLEADANAARTILNKDVATPKVYELRILYDYKTNRLTAGWVPTDEPTFNEDVILIDQMIIYREGDGEASKVNIQNTGGIVVVDKMTTEFALDKDVEWNKWKDIADDSEHRRYMFYWLSLPYKCKISEIYGMGVYGEKFEIQRYRGDLRALGQAGSNFGTSAWRKLKNTATMEANRGYVIALKLKESDFKSAEGKSYARLFFPSTESVKLEHKTQTVLPENEDSKTSNIHWDWYIMGNPLLTSGRAANLVEPASWDQELNYVYTWDYANGDRIYTPMSLDEVELKATHSYMVQAKGELNWAYPTTNSNAPTRTFEATEFASGDGFGVQNIRLNLMENGNQVDKTYIMYRPNGTREYEIGRDLDKIINSGCSQMYSSMNEPLASICLNSEDEEMIPLTFVVTNKTAEYTVRLNKPMGNNLVPSIYDGQTGEYKNLSFGDVTLDLVKGTNEGRYFFVLKKNGVITNTDELNGNLYDQTQKVIMNDHLFIIRDGKLYDGVGASVK